MTNENAAIVAVENANEAIQSVEFTPVTGYVCTLDLSDDAQKARMIAAYNDAEPLSQHVGEAIKLADVVTMPGTRKSRIQGVPDSECQNTYLIDTDGVSYFSQSDGVARSVNMLVSAFPSLDYGEQGYIEVVCVEKQLSNGNTMKTVRPILS